MQRTRQEKTVNVSHVGPPVVIIGAGYAGLTCASLLQKKGVDVLVVEAQNYVGGRVKQVKGFVDWKDLDVGSEFIHGEKSMLRSLVDSNGWPCRVLFTWAQGDGSTPEYPIGGGISLYYLGREKKIVRYDTEDPEIRKVNQILWGLCELKPAPGDKRSLDQYLRALDVTPRALGLAEAGYGNTIGASLDRLSLEGVTQLESAWYNYGPGDYRLDNSMSVVTDRLSVDVNIVTEWPVKNVTYDAQKDLFTISNIHGESVHASRVVVTVPLPIIKDNDIEFVPALPAEKIKAAKSIGYDNAVKIIMKFSQRFWPCEVHGVVCSDSFIPEFWFEEPNRVGVLTPQSKPPPKVGSQPVVSGTTTITMITTTTTINPSGEVKASSVVTTQPLLTYVVSGFVTSKSAEKLANMTRQEIIDNMLRQLDDMFCNKSAHGLLEKTVVDPFNDESKINWKSPASSTFLDCVIVDWGRNPYIKGGYSFPSLEATSQIREELAKPVMDRIFFAGEATSATSFLTVQGAMETGERAALEVLETIPKPEKKVGAKLFSKL